MNNYLTELSAIHLALIAAYCAILRRELQYGMVRLYLLCSVVLALVIPLCKFPRLFPDDNPVVAAPVGDISLSAITVPPPAANAIGHYDWVIWVYGVVSLLFFIKFLHGVIFLIRLRRNLGTLQKSRGLHIFNMPHFQGSFSFFNWVFLGDGLDTTAREMILKHEEGHALLGHTYDLIFLDLFKVCFWWLPTAWFVKHEMRKIHEFQADAHVLASFSPDGYSHMLVTSTLKMNGMNVTSPFGNAFVLQRLKAINQETKSISPWKHMTLAGLCAVLFIAFACTEDKSMAEASGEALRAQVEGRVDVGFVVEKDGSVSHVKVLNGIAADCDREAERIVRSGPAFPIATQHGKPVRVRMVVPVIFRFQGTKARESGDKWVSVFLGKARADNGKLKVLAKYQVGEWSGTVHDEDGYGLPGVHISHANTAGVTVSDSIGFFSVRAGESEDLYLSFTGYESTRLSSN